MISFIEGALSECGIFHSVVDVNGIGYFVNMPLTVSSKMPTIGSKVKLYTYVVYREDKQDMYGFLSKEERDFFKLVVEKVSGVGPKTTLNLMSKLSLSIIKRYLGKVSWHRQKVCRTYHNGTVRQKFTQRRKFILSGHIVQYPALIAR